MILRSSSEEVGEVASDLARWPRRRRILVMQIRGLKVELGYRPSEEGKEGERM